jgi:hypothetical protein
VTNDKVIANQIISYFFDKHELYRNQKETAKKVVNYYKYNSDLIFQLIIGPTQSGKTGCMLSILYYTITTYNVHLSNIYIITGLSSIDWKEQMKNRTPEPLHVNVFHRPDLDETFHDSIKDKRNVLILIFIPSIGTIFRCPTRLL